MLKYIYIVLFVFSVILVVFSVVYGLFSKIPNLLEKIRNLIIPSSVKNYLIFAVVFIITFYLFNNIVPALLAGIICTIAPTQYLYLRQRKKRKLVLSQLSTAVRIFTSEFTTSKNITKSLGLTGKSTPEPVGGYFRQAYSDIVFGKDINLALDELANNLNISYGYMFVELLKITNKQGMSSIPLFHELVSRITKAQEYESFKETEVSGENLFNLLLILLPIPGYFFIRIILPEIEYFLASQIGTVLFSLWLMSIILWFLTDRYINDM